MKYCGIDAASKRSQFCVIDGEDERIWEGPVEMSEASIKKALKWLKKEKLSCVVETGSSSEWLCKVMESLGHKIVIIDARKAKAAVNSRGKKTDRTDARSLAHICRTGFYTAVHRKSDKSRELRSKMTARSVVQKTVRMTNSAIRGLLRGYGVQVGEVSVGKFAEHVLKLAEERVPVLMESVRSLLEVWGRALVEVAKFDEELKAQAKQHPVCKKLQRVGGVGPLVALGFVTAIDDPARFKSAAQVGAYLGLVPRVQQSGESGYLGRITKEGDGTARALLVSAATVLLCATKSSCELKTWGLKLVEKKGMGKARVAVARKLAKLMFHLWQTGERYQPMLAA